MDIAQLRRHVIEPTLLYVGAELPGFASQAAVELLLGTIAQESRFRYLRQLGDGPARGLYQIEPATRRDVHHSWLRYREQARAAVERLMAPWPHPDDQLASNLAYATAIARIVYYRRPDPLPEPGDVAGYAAYWKRHYNTPLGRGTEEEFTLNFNRLVRGQS